MPDASSRQYGFYDRLNAEFPSQIIVDATEVCNLACIHCPHPEFKKSEHYSASYLAAELNRKMVDEVRQAGRGRTQYIRYTSNGEPLVHPDIYEMLEYAVRESGVFVTITTNGTTLKEKRIRKLFASGLHMVDISIDAFSEEVYGEIRVNGDLRVTRDNVLLLLRIRRELNVDTRIVVSFVEQPKNSSEVDAFEKYWKAQGVDQVVVRRLHSAAGGVVRIADIMRTRKENVARYPCVYPWERILLNPRGQLAFCPQDWTHGSALADYRDTTIAELWKSDGYRRLRDAHLGNDFSNHRFCGQCPDWRETRWPGAGRSYADMVQEFAGQA